MFKKIIIGGLILINGFASLCATPFNPNNSYLKNLKINNPEVVRGDTTFYDKNNDELVDRVVIKYGKHNTYISDNDYNGIFEKSSKKYNLEESEYKWNNQTGEFDSFESYSREEKKLPNNITTTLNTDLKINKEGRVKKTIDTRTKEGAYMLAEIRNTSSTSALSEDLKIKEFYRAQEIKKLNQLTYSNGRTSIYIYLKNQYVYPTKNGEQIDETLVYDEGFDSKEYRFFDSDGDGFIDTINISSQFSELGKGKSEIIKIKDPVNWEFNESDYYKPNLDGRNEKMIY